MEEKEASVHDLLSKAEEEGKNNDISSAIKTYGEILKTDTMQIPAYDGLMKIYRKNKDYKRELKVIKSAIKAYEKYYASSGNHSKQVKSISEKLNKSFGLVDKKGNRIYYPEPIGRWQTRKEVVEKKLSK